MNWDRKTVATGVMNSSTDNSRAGLPWPYSLMRGPGRVELDVDAARLLNDGVEVVVDRRGVEGVDDLGVGMATRGRDLLGDHLDARGRAAGEKHLRTFGRQFLRHRRADGTSTTEHDRTLVLQHS